MPGPGFSDIATSCQHVTLGKPEPPKTNRTSHTHPAEASRFPHPVAPKLDERTRFHLAARHREGTAGRRARAGRAGGRRTPALPPPALEPAVPARLGSAAAGAAKGGCRGRRRGSRRGRLQGPPPREPAGGNAPLLCHHRHRIGRQAFPSPRRTGDAGGPPCEPGSTPTGWGAAPLESTGPPALESAPGTALGAWRWTRWSCHREQRRGCRWRPSHRRWTPSKQCRQSCPAAGKQDS